MTLSICDQRAPQPAPAPASLVFHLLETEAEWREIHSEWDRLYQEHAPRNPFLSREWTEACWERVRPRCKPFVITARAGHQLVGLASLCLEWRWGFRVLRFIGDGRSDYLGFLCRADRPDAELALWAEVARLRNRWDLALLRYLAAPYSLLLQHPVPEGVSGCQSEPRAVAYAPCPGSGAPAEQLPGWLSRMPKKVRKWERLGGSARRYTGPAALAQLATVTAIEARSWKGRQRTGRFQTGTGRQFLHRIVSGLAVREEVELWIAYAGAVPIAFELNLLPPGAVWLYQGAYDEEYRKLGAGSILEFVSIQRAAAAGAQEYDYLTGEESYKDERTSAQRTLRHLALYPNTLRGRLARQVLLPRSWSRIEPRPK